MNALNHYHNFKRLTRIVLLILSVIACSKNNTTTGSYSNPENPQSYTPSVEVIEGDCSADMVLCKNGNWCCPADAVCVVNTDNALGCGNDYCCLACDEELPCGLGCCPVGRQCVVNPGEDSPCDTVLCCESGGEVSTCPSDIAAKCPDGTSCVAYRDATICPEQYTCLTPDGDIGCLGETLCQNGHDFCPATLACEEKGSQPCRVYSTNKIYCCGEVANPAACPEKTCGEGCCEPEKDCVENTGNTLSCQKSHCCVDYDVGVEGRDAGVYDAGHSSPSGHDAGGTDAGTTDAGVCPSVYAPGFTVECPNGSDCCLTGTYCGFQQGVCMIGSFGGNYCCLMPTCSDWSAMCECSFRSCSDLDQSWYETSTGGKYTCASIGECTGAASALATACCPDNE